jgi:biofilm protein TabA
MVFDKINNSNQYIMLHKYFAKAFTFIHQYEKNPLSDGIYEIDGKEIFAIVESYYTKEEKTQNFEAHRKYIDIQYIHTGREKIGYNNITSMNAIDKYSTKNDIIFFDGQHKFWINIEEKEFVILFPEDAHMPCIKSGNTNCEVKKIVVKLKYN